MRYALVDIQPWIVGLMAIGVGFACGLLLVEATPHFVSALHYLHETITTAHPAISFADLHR